MDQKNPEKNLSTSKFYEELSRSLCFKKKNNKRLYLTKNIFKVVGDDLNTEDIP